MAGVGMGHAQVDFSFRPIRLLCQTSFKGGNASSVVAALQPQVAQPEPGVLEAWIFLHQFRVHGFRLVQLSLALRHPGHLKAQVIPVGRNLNGSLKARARLAQIFQFQVGHAQIHVRVDGFLADIARLLVGLNRLRQTSQSLISDAQVEPVVIDRRAPVR